MLVQEDAIRHADEFSLKAWDAARPFPLTNPQCTALLRGHAVRWAGGPDDLAGLPGRFELIDGWLILKR